MGCGNSCPQPNPGGCTDPFTCGDKIKRSQAQVFKRAVQDAYEQNPLLVHILMCLLLFFVVFTLTGLFVLRRRMNKVDKEVGRLKRSNAHPQNGKEYTVYKDYKLSDRMDPLWVDFDLKHPVEEKV